MNDDRDLCARDARAARGTGVYVMEHSMNADDDLPDVLIQRACNRVDGLLTQQSAD